jgi:predicted 3-demethylubiquinone-9 3-methyltransferase (glyoxalase superfamily)
MSNKIYPCLWFDGYAEEAVNHYISLFDNSKIVTKTPMVVDFELHGQKFMALNGGPMFKINPSISFYVACKNEAEVDTLWHTLIEGGFAMMALDKYPWSEKYGWLQDRFGMTWQITIDHNIPQKITPSMLFTEGVHGKGQDALAFYTALFDNSSVVHASYYAAGQNPYATEGMVLFALFNLGGQLFIIMDAGAPQSYTFNEAVSYVVDCKNQEEVDDFWEKLTADGGTESQCAWLRDKFGVSWQIVPRQLTTLLNDPDKDKANRVLQAMLKMKKIDIQKLEEAVK